MEGQRHAGAYAIIDVRIDTSDFRSAGAGGSTRRQPGGTLIMFKKPGGMLRWRLPVARDDEPTEGSHAARARARQVQAHLAMLGSTSPGDRSG